MSIPWTNNAEKNSNIKFYKNRIKRMEKFNNGKESSKKNIVAQKRSHFRLMY